MMMDGGRPRIGAERAADFEARHAGQHQIENGQVHRLLARVGQRVGARRREIRRPAVLLDVSRDQFADVSIVFGNEHMHCTNGSVATGLEIRPRARAVACGCVKAMLRRTGY
jgi:hypothetical protein